MDNPIKLEKSEQEIIEAANELSVVLNSQGWKRITEWMDAWIDEAHSRMSQSLSHNPQVALTLQLRWKERRDMKEALLGVIQQTIDAKHEVLILIAKSRGASEEDARQFASSGIF